MSQDITIDKAYLEALKHEAKKLYVFAKQLNANQAFNKVVHNLMRSNAKLANLKITSEHLISQDLVHLYNMSIGDKISNKNNKGEFTLVYYFEALKGNDMTITLEKAKKMVEQEGFDRYVKDITEAESKNSKSFIVSSILQQVDRKLLDQYAVLMYRFANLIVKSDGEITKEEAKTLEEILGLLNINNPSDYKKHGIPDNETLEDVLAELNLLIGLENVKKAISEFTNFLKVQKMRKAEDLKTTNNALHSVFMGPPGTGKTTVARLLGRVFKHLGYLEKGHIIETDRAGLVAGYVGQTATKVDELIKSALGGVLFIDEAYSLLSGGQQNDFGSEAIEILLKRMEDHRGELVVVVAGYPTEMKEFVRSNPGLQSRFNRYYDFKHFEANELYKIFKLFATLADFKLSEDASDKLKEIFERLYEKRNSSFGNARVVRNLFERIIEIQANRIVAITPVSKNLLITIEESDVPPINKTVDDILMLT